MSFVLLEVEPVYDCFSESYSWTFYNIIRLKQYLLLDGKVKYVLLTGLSQHETLFISETKELTKVEIKKLLKLLTVRIWKYLSKEADQANGNFNTFNKYSLELEKKGWI